MEGRPIIEGCFIFVTETEIMIISFRLISCEVCSPNGNFDLSLSGALHSFSVVGPCLVWETLPLCVYPTSRGTGLAALCLLVLEEDWALSFDYSLEGDWALAFVS